MSADRSTPTDYERLGGELGLRRIVIDFIDAVYADVIIGFFFESVDREALVEREIEFAAQHLGGPRAYRGRPIGPVHRPHRINRGQFHRRLWCLERVLRRHGIEPDVIDRWLAHSRTLEPIVTNGRDCLD